MLCIRYTRNEQGIVLVVAMWLLVAVTLLGSTAALIVTTNSQVGKNAESAMRHFYTVEAGVEETRARLRINYPNPLPDTAKTSLTWRGFVGTDAKAQALGYDSTNPEHIRVDSLQNTLAYTVEVKHSTTTDAGGNTVVALWGDPDGDGVSGVNATEGENIYTITSHGSKPVEVEAAVLPPVEAPGVLYVEAETNILGTSTHINGLDQCGSMNMPGVATRLALSEVYENGNPDIQGTPRIKDFTRNLDIQGIIKQIEPYADKHYPGPGQDNYYTSNQTQTATATPGPGDGWGTPIMGATLQNPSSCTDLHVIHYNLNNNRLIKLHGGVQGCGFLLVEGDLEIGGDFFWYGVILSTGSITFTGGGNKNITGNVLSEGEVDVDVVGGNANIIHCSSVSTILRNGLPLHVLRWLEPIDG